MNDPDERRRRLDASGWSLIRSRLLEHEPDFPEEHDGYGLIPDLGSEPRWIVGRRSSRSTGRSSSS